VSWIAHHTSVLEQLAVVPDASFDASLLDPPYGLGPHQPTAAELRAYIRGANVELSSGGDFMGHDWNVPSVGTWEALWRALKPGAFLVTFGGSRTFDLITLGLRMAGFEIRDTIVWLYGSGFPHYQNASKALDADADDESEIVVPTTDLAADWEGWATALKPAFEPIIIARKPLIGILAENIRVHGTGALNIDASRIERDYAERSESWKRSGHSAKPDAEKIAAPPGNGIELHPKGGWPSNVCLDEEAAELLDVSTGTLVTHAGDVKHHHAAIGYGGGGSGSARTVLPSSGGASRFFYVAKATHEERDRGCGHLPIRSAAETTGSKDGQARLNCPSTGAGRTSGARNFHPTVKPVALTRWLAGLLLPPPRDGAPRRLLVPYAGSGSEMIGALLAGWDEVEGIERDAEFLPILRARVSLAETNPRAFEPFANRKPQRVPDAQASLF